VTVGSGAGTPTWLVLLAAVAGLGVGGLLARQLTQLGYRLDDEVGVRAPLPGWLVVLGTGLLWAALAWRLAPWSGWALLPALLCFSTVAVALTWIDLDVHRLPEGLTLPAYAVLLGQLALAAWAGQEWPALVRGVLCSLALAALALLLALIAARLGSGFGLGDVVLSGLVGLVTGYVAWWRPVVALYAAFLLGGAYALVLVVTRRRSRRDAVPFGPFLAAGAVVAFFVDVPSFLI
jgi:leader peptidase (prepilin peptidase)/N-methyltransferase